MRITVTPEMLCTLCGGKFTLEACNAICELFEECGEAPMIGDICVSYGEIPADWTDEYDDDNLIATLDNGNVLIAY